MKEEECVRGAREENLRVKRRESEHKLNNRRMVKEEEKERREQGEGLGKVRKKTNARRKEEKNGKRLWSV